MPGFHAAYSSPWRHIALRCASPSHGRALFSSSIFHRPSNNGLTRPCRYFLSTAPHKSQRRRRFQFQFRPRQSFGVLLAAQLVVIYKVVHEARASDGTFNGEQSVLLNTTEFTQYTLVRKEVVSENSCILALQPSTTTARYTRAPTWSDPYSFIRSWVRDFRNINVSNLEPKIERLKAYHDGLWKQGIWSVEIKQPQLMIARRYTPLPPETNPLSPALSAPSISDGSAPAQQIKLFVRREPYGEVSRYLYSLPEGTTLELRGGFVEFEVPDDVSDIVFIAGGTGIAPALGVANTLASRGADARVQVLWANRRREDCIGGENVDAAGGFISSLLQMTGLGRDPKIYHDRELDGGESTLVRQLEAFRRPSDENTMSNRLDMATRYFVDEEDTFIQSEDIAKALQQSTKRKENCIRVEGYPNGRRLVLLSGPDGFIEYVAGPDVLRNGIEKQHDIQGLLAHVDLRGWEVRKL